MKIEELNRKIVLTALSVCLAFLATEPIQAAFGDLDTTFGTAGIFADTSMTYLPSGVARQGDGKFLVTGYNGDINQGGGILVLRRYNANGSVDTTFGAGGTAIPYNQFGHGERILVQSDGKIVVIGSAVWRFNSNGWYDSTFGLQGKVNYSGFTGAIYQPTRLVSPKIFVVTIPSTSNNYLIWRLNSNGVLDTTFGSNGSVTVPILNTAGSRSFQVKSGSLYLIGEANGAAIAKYTVNGQPDPTFGVQGIASHPYTETYAFFGCPGATPMGTFNVGFAIQSNGRIALATSAAHLQTFGSFLVGLHPDGSLDAGYDQNPCMFPYNTTYYPIALGLANDSLLVASPAPGVVNISRYDSGGIPDAQFFFSSSTVSDMIEQPDGKFILVGTQGAYPNEIVTLSRHSPI